MEKLTITDTTIGNISLPFVSLKLSNDELQKAQELRIFQLPTIGGKPLIDFAQEMLVGFRDCSEDVAEKAYYDEQLSLVLLHSMFPSLDKRNSRKFTLESLNRSQSMAELSEATKTVGAKPYEKISAFAGGATGCSTSELLEQALYESPGISLPVTDLEYEDFRSDFFKGLKSITNKIFEITENVLSHTSSQVNKKVGKELRGKVRQLLKDAKNGKKPELIAELFRIGAKVLIDHVLEDEEKKTRPFADLAKGVECLQIQIDNYIAKNEIIVLEENGGKLTPQFIECLPSIMNAIELDRLIDEFSERFEQLYPLLPVYLIDINEQNLGQSIAISEDETVPDVKLSVEQHYYVALRSARFSDDLFYKYCTLCRIRAQMVNRVECFRLINREAELAVFEMLGNANRLVYRAIRHALSPQERRLFILMYLPQKYLGGRIAMLDPLINALILNLDEESQLLLLQGVMEDDSLESWSEFRRRWEIYLRFYPHWLELIQSDERIRKRHTREKAHGMASLDMPLSGRGNELSLSSMVEDRRREPSEMASVLRHFFATDYLALISKVCTKKQTDILIAHFQNGETEQQIAEKHGITQQAVNKAIKAAYQLIRTALTNPDDHQFTGAA